MVEEDIEVTVVEVVDVVDRAVDVVVDVGRTHAPPAQILAPRQVTADALGTAASQNHSFRFIPPVHSSE